MSENPQDVQPDEQQPEEGPDITELPDDPAYAGGEEGDEDAGRVRGG